MERLEELLEHIATRVNVNLAHMGIDVVPILKNAIPRERHLLFYAFYALTNDHPVSFRFINSSLGGTYFLGRTLVENSVLYKSDIRGDELKRKGDVVEFGGIKTRLFSDEVIRILNSYLVKTLVHNHSKNPEIPEVFKILNTVAMHYSNIHGTTTESVFLGPFATVDFAYIKNCVVGEFAYVQADGVSRQVIEPGRVWVRHKGVFEFNYVFPREVLRKYVSMDENGTLSGEFFQHTSKREEDFVPLYSAVWPEPFEAKGRDSYVSPYSVIKGDCVIGDNALVAQRVHIENSVMGKGSNAQENCHISNSIYDGFDITAHGAKVINTHLAKNVFVGFNAFLHGRKPQHITVGRNSIVMPHTIIDSDEPIAIPDNSLVWGLITRQADLSTQCIDLDDMARADNLAMGNMTFTGNGKAFVDAFKVRIEHILEANGAYYDGTKGTRGHAQQIQDACYNILQPFQSGPERGMYPPMTIGE